jgi:hypothetical protein
MEIYNNASTIVTNDKKWKKLKIQIINNYINRYNYFNHKNIEKKKEWVNKIFDIYENINDIYPYYIYYISKLIIFEIYRNALKIISTYSNIDNDPDYNQITKIINDLKKKIYTDWKINLYLY